MVYAYVPNFVSIGLFCRPLLARNPNFADFWTSAFSAVASWQQSVDVEQGCTTTNLRLSKGIKIVSVLQHRVRRKTDRLSRILTFQDIHTMLHAVMNVHAILKICKHVR